MFDMESYEKARTVEEAVALLSRNPEAVPMAGGTDLLMRLRRGEARCRHVVDIHDVPELKGIHIEADGAVRVGAGATFTQVMESPAARRYLPVLVEGAASVGGPQIRNMGTIGGNICNGAPSADTAAPLLVHEAEAFLTGPRGTRRVPVTEFYHGPGQVDLNHGEILTHFRIAPENHHCWSGSYYKYAVRGAMDIATIGCAALLKLEAGRVAGFRMAFTVAGPTPLRCWKTEEKALGRTPGRELVRLVEDTVLSDLRPRDSWRASRAFREHLIRSLSGRVLERAFLACGGAP